MITATTVLFIFGSFVCGYLIGRVDLLLGRTYSRPRRRKTRPAQPAGFFTKQTSARETANTRKVTPVDDIDTRVYVTPISTSELTKTTAVALGNTSTIDDNINQSVSKLAQLKGQS